MFREPGIMHAMLLALLVPLLFLIRRRVPRALKREPRDDDAEASRARWHRFLLLELTELVLAGVFLLVGGAKLVGRPDMVVLFQHIGVGQWLRYLTGTIEVAGAALMIVPIASGGSALVLGTLMIAATLIELLVLHRPPVAAAACLSGHTYVAWARLASPRRTFVSIMPRRARRAFRPHGDVRAQRTARMLR